MPPAAPLFQLAFVVRNLAAPRIAVFRPIRSDLPQYLPRLRFGIEYAFPRRLAGLPPGFRLTQMPLTTPRAFVDTVDGNPSCQRFPAGDQSFHVRIHRALWAPAFHPFPYSISFSVRRGPRHTLGAGLLSLISTHCWGPGCSLTDRGPGGIEPPVPVLGRGTPTLVALVARFRGPVRADRLPTSPPPTRCSLPAVPPHV
jgi:hypothetical protein